MRGAFLYAETPWRKPRLSPLSPATPAPGISPASRPFHHDHTNHV